MLVIVDPATSYLSERINSNNDASVRKAMSPLAQLARDTGAAMVLVRHLNKNSSEKNHKYRGGGSIAFFAAARASLMFGTHPDDHSLMVMAQAKKNIATPMPSLSYRIVSSDEDERIPVIQWEGAVDVDAHTVLGGRDGRRESPDRDEAESILMKLLEENGGSVASSEAFQVCKGLGISIATVRRAQKRIGLITKAVRNADTGKVDHWLWSYPLGEKVRLQARVNGQVTPDEPR